MVNARIEDLLDILGEEYMKLENTFVMRNNQEMTKGIYSLNNYKAKQLAGRDKYSKKLAKMAKERIAGVNKKVEKIFLLSYATTNKDMIEVKIDEIRVKDLPKSAKHTLENMKSYNEKFIKSLAVNAYKQYNKSIQMISNSKVGDEIYRTIKKQMAYGIDNGIKIAYRVNKPGKKYGEVRNMSFKSYMEMKARTDINTEISANQVKHGAEAGIIFYFVDAFADCAKDHLNYQGKIYYNEGAELTPEARKYINQHHIKGMEWVRGAPVWLTTRPNCRHSFHAVPYSDVIKDTGTYKERYTYGKAKTNNYKATEQQRRNERLIRTYKLKRDNYLAEYSATKDKSFKIKANYYKSLVDKWIAENRKLINDNKFLSREPSRERTNYIVDNLGVNYDYK